MKKGVVLGLVFLLLVGAAAAVFSFSKEGTEQPKGATVAARSTLVMKPWTWVSTTYSQGKVIRAKSEKFKLTFDKDGHLSSTTDCNTLGGQYSTDERQISVSQIVSTQMYCENSQEKDYIKALSQVGSFFFRTTGELVFDLQYDNGSIIFD